MGYTHYWRVPSNLGATAKGRQKFATWVGEVAKIATESGVPIAGWDGTGEPEFVVGGVHQSGDKKRPVKEDAYVSLNGVESELRDDSHETFRIGSAKNDFSFCKTARKPYDVVVTAALIRLHHHFGSKVEVSSDGDAEDWAPAVELCQRLFGEAELPPRVMD